MSKCVKWKCRNCGDIFESKDKFCVKDDFIIHSEHCFMLEDFFEILERGEEDEK